MPFQSEKQRRYLWANEPEIARDWTDTYGSGIAKALGGRIGFWNGSGNIRQQPHQPRDLLVQNNPYGTRPRYQPPGGGETSLGSGAAYSGGASDRGPRDAPDRHGPVQPAPPTRSRIQDERQEDFRKKQMSDLLARQQAEKDYTRTGQIRPGPQLGLARSGVGGGLGNWASQFAGSKIGGGLGSMLFGPWGMLLGSLFGRGVGRRGWQASQTDEKESLKDVLFPEAIQSYFNREKTPTIGGEGITGTDASTQFANARRLMTQSSQIPGANPLLQADPYQQTYLRNPNETFTLGSSMYESPKRSAKDFIDLSKSYSETDIIPSKYAGADLAKFAGSEYDVKTSLEKNPELHQEMNDAATKAQNEYVAKIQSGEIPFPDNLQLEMDKVGNDARHNIMQSQSDAPDIFSETLQEGLDKSNVQGKQKRSREQELLKEMGI